MSRKAAHAQPMESYSARDAVRRREADSQSPGLEFALHYIPMLLAALWK